MTPARMATFLDHLAELRSKLLISIGAVVIGAIIAHLYHDTIIAFLLKPVRGEQLFFLSPQGALLFILKVDLFAGALLAFPVVCLSGFSFLKPAMGRASWLLFSGLFAFASLLLLAGLAYAYYVLAPLTLGFLLSISVPGIDSMITADSYLRFLFTQTLIIAAVFQIPLVIIAGTLIGVIDPAVLTGVRRYVYVTGLIAIAILTPTTDLVSFAMVAVPAAIIFEGSLVASRVIGRVMRETVGAA